MEAVTVEKITEMDHLAETFGKNSLTAQYRKSSGDNVVKIVRQCHESKHLVGEFRFMTNFRNQADISAWRFMECQFDVEEAGTRRDAVEGHRWLSGKHIAFFKNQLVQFQFAHFNCAALDLARLMMSTLSGKVKITRANLYFQPKNGAFLGSARTLRRDYRNLL